VSAQNETRYDFRQPGTGVFLRVEWRPDPEPDPTETWRQNAASRFGGDPGYEEIRIEDTTYRDYDAGMWEFTHEGRHVENLGFVTNGRGYALYFSAPEELWDETAGLRQQFRDAFQPT
jgi:hypothetical protein